MISDAISLELIARIVGYKMLTADFSTTSPNLPIKIGVNCEANEANQSNFTGNVEFEATTLTQVAEKFGYGSPAYTIMRILRPPQSSGVGGIPISFYVQKKASGATSKKIEITPVGTATKGGTHYLVVCGRKGLDNEFYAINVNQGDGPAQLTGKMSDALNNILGCPVIASDDDYVTTCESKWKGLSAEDVNISVDTGTDDLGLSYSISVTQNGVGTPSIATALNNIGSSWVNLIVSGYPPEASTILDSYESFNGIPDPNNPSGRYSAIIMKPFIALIGSTNDDDSAITDARLNDVTNAWCPAPGSAGLPMEAAANMCVLEAVCAQNTPELDIMGQAYPDMPTASTAGSMEQYLTRDAFVKKGLTTVTVEAGKYIVQDFCTTYHKAGENPAQFRYVRDLFVHFNVRYGYLLLEAKYVLGHVISTDDTITKTSKVIKPKQWKKILFAFADDLGERSLLVIPKFMKDSLRVGIGTANPNRFETAFSMKISGTARQSSTTVTVGFNFGTL